MTIGPDGLLYMSNLATNTIDRYTLSGTPLGTYITSAVLGPSYQPTGLAFYNNQLYVSKQAGFPGAPPGSGGVFKYDGTSMVPVVTNITQAEGLVVVGNNLFIGELNNYVNGGRILKHDLINNITTTFVDQVGTAHAPTGMALGPDGMLYVADVTGFEIHRYDPNNAAINSTVVSGGPLVTGQGPNGVAFFGSSMYVPVFGTGGGPDAVLLRYNDIGGGNYVLAGNAVSGLIVASAVIAVPEPTSMALLLVPVGGWIIRRRLKK
jgi:hypothetical protein